MSSKTKDDSALREYVDQSIDTQREYTENLFSRAEARVTRLINEQVEAKLKEALNVIRPAAVETSLLSANHAALLKLRSQMDSIVCEYQNATGLRVKHVVFANVDGLVVSKAVISNV